MAPLRRWRAGRSVTARSITRQELAAESRVRVAGAPVAIRFGRLGDLVLVQPALTALALRYGAPITLVTSAPYVALARLFPGVGEVISWPEGGGWPELVALAHRLRPGEPREVVDLHGSVRSRTLVTLLGRPSTVIRKQSVYRRVRLRFPGMPPPRTLTSRALEAVGIPPGEEGCGARPALPQSMLPPSRAPAWEPSLGLCPGASAPTKTWPPERWAELARRWADRTRGRAAVFGAAGEADLVERVVVSAGGAATAFCDPSLPATAAALSRCAVAVAGDSGLLHLAAAVGTPVVGLFGPTGVDMGYWTWEGRGEAVRVEGLACSPCSLYGGRRCPRRHHRCMADLTAERALAAALAAARLG